MAAEAYMQMPFMLITLFCADRYHLHGHHRNLVAKGAFHQTDTIEISKNIMERIIE